MQVSSTGVDGVGPTQEIERFIVEPLSRTKRSLQIRQASLQYRVAGSASTTALGHGKGCLGSHLIPQDPQAIASVGPSARPKVLHDSFPLDGVQVVGRETNEIRRFQRLLGRGEPLLFAVLEQAMAEEPRPVPRTVAHQEVAASQGLTQNLLERYLGLMKILVEHIGSLLNSANDSAKDPTVGLLFRSRRSVPRDGKISDRFARDSFLEALIFRAGSTPRVDRLLLFCTTYHAAGFLIH